MKNERADATRSELLGGVILVVLALGVVILLHFLFPREVETPGIHRVDKAPGSDFGACDVERQPAPQSAIALQQPDWMKDPLDEWCVLDAATSVVVERISRSWEPQNVPAGAYRVRVRQYASDGMDITLPQIVNVGEGELVRLKFCGGIKPEPAEWAPTPYQWGVVNREGEYLQFASGRWDALLIPPGFHRVAIQPTADSARIVYARGVGVSSTGLETVNVDSGVTVEAASWVPIPYAWFVVDRAKGADVQVCKGEWAKLLIPPGKYDICLQPEEKGSVRMPYINLDIPPRQLVVVKVDTGVEIDPAKWMEKPRSWAIRNVHTKKVVQQVRGEWGKAVVPPGKYLIAVRPGGYNEKAVVFGPIAIQARRLNKVALRSGVRLIGAEKTTPLGWSVVDAKSGEVVQTVRGHGGTAIVPPGTYKITVRLPGKEGEKEIVAAEKVVVGEGRSDVTVALPKSGD